MFKICAVVVTYNRKELLLRNISSLLSQTYPLDILIYDNASTDGTYDFLVQKKILVNDHIKYLCGESNTGGAGGFCRGEKAAMELGYDYLWLMDDDGYCLENNTLEELVNTIDSSKKQILNSYVLCDYKNKELTFNLGPFETDSEVKNNSLENQLCGYGNPYNGTLVPRKCFEEIGYTDERFFIYGDEVDFSYRSRNAGYEWITVISSFYFHPINRNINKKKFLGREYEIKEQPVWKYYIECRNSVYIGKKYCNLKHKYTQIVKMLLTAFYSKDKILQRIKWGIHGINDGFNENFKREIPFKI